MDIATPKMTMREKSDCFRVFLLLIGSDRIISGGEKQILLDIGRKLDFAFDFCEEAISDLLENKHIDQSPPLFSHPEFAKSCLQDCLRIASVDSTIHPREMEWIKSIARANGITSEWLYEQIKAQAGSHGNQGAAEDLSIGAHL